MRVAMPALIALLASLAATMAAWWAASAQNDALASARFEAEARRTVSAVTERMETYAQILRGGLGLLEASDEVDRDEWWRYVSRLEIDKGLPGIQGMGFALRTPPERLERLEAEIRAEGIARFKIYPPGLREVYYPIIYLEPMRGRNLWALGFDMFAESVRRAAMERARDTGQPALSGKVRLVQESGEDGQAGTLLYIPFYGGQADPATVAERRRAIEGFVYAPFRMDDLIVGVLRSDVTHIGLTIWDQEKTDESVMFRTFADGSPGYSSTDYVDMFGRTWIIEVTSTKVLEAGIEENFPSIILIAGTIISLLVMGATQAMLMARARAESLAESNQALDAARLAAENANQSKSRFLAAASHDLRQPLQSLGIYLGMLAEARLPKHESILARSATESFETAQRLLNSIMDIAALESGGVEVRADRFDAAPLLEGIVSTMRAEAERKGLFLRLRVRSAMVRTDRVMLERMVRNLVDNALKYTNRGGVLVTCRQAGDSVRIKVADSGPGISPDHQSLIFEDFYQIGNPERDRSKGLGLGLSIVARLSRLLGYRLEIKSRLGLGSSFILVIPSESLS